MFSIFKKSAIAEHTDKVWKTRQACLKGISTEALNAVKNQEIPVVFFFFDDAKKDLVQFMTDHKIPFAAMDEDPQIEGTIILADALSILHSTNWLLNRSKKSKLSFLFLGHYPLPGPEDRVLEKLKPFQPTGRVLFYLSLEDALLANFGGDRIRPLMESLGMDEDECVEHAMINKAIFNARKKLEEKITAEMKTRSEKDWFIKNLTTIS
jgi:hypothetical protein